MKKKTLRFALNNFESDQIQILRMLEKVKDHYAKSAVVRQATLAVIGRLDNNAKKLQVRKVVDWVKDKLVYIRDPVGEEFVISPVQMLKEIATKGYSYGDCDDHAMLVNTMLQSIGFETRFVGVKLNQDERFNHVIACIDYNGDWINLDACAKLSPMQSYQELLTVK